MADAEWRRFNVERGGGGGGRELTMARQCWERDIQHYTNELLLRGIHSHLCGQAREISCIPTHYHCNTTRIVPELREISGLVTIQEVWI